MDADELDPHDFSESALAPGRRPWTKPLTPKDRELLKELQEAVQMRLCLVCGADVGEACREIEPAPPVRLGVAHTVRLRKLKPGEAGLAEVRERIEAQLERARAYAEWALGELCWCGAQPGERCPSVKARKRLHHVHDGRGGVQRPRIGPAGQTGPPRP
ncbi:hypothetical protein ABT224_41520 [Streptomyces sp. NPDC001584]|uniref:hypothetical protein n=1 Tax=Streptomyces sp. NPDC001584 TaxID=3154521 RepID=UPI00332E3632